MRYQIDLVIQNMYVCNFLHYILSILKDFVYVIKCVRFMIFIYIFYICNGNIKIEKICTALGLKNVDLFKI